jgi:hypothetical protein
MAVSCHGFNESRLAQAAIQSKLGGNGMGAGQSCVMSDNKQKSIKKCDDHQVKVTNLSVLLQGNFI